MNEDDGIERRYGASRRNWSRRMREENYSASSREKRHRQRESLGGKGSDDYFKVGLLQTTLLSQGGCPISTVRSCLGNESRWLAAIPPINLVIAYSLACFTLC